MWPRNSNLQIQEKDDTMINHNVRKDMLERNYQYRRLQDQHEKLENEIEVLRQKPTADSTRLYALKRQKLHLRDQMHKLSRVH